MRQLHHRAKHPHYPVKLHHHLAKLPYHPQGSRMRWQASPLVSQLPALSAPWMNIGTGWRLRCTVSSR